MIISAMVKRLDFDLSINGDLMRHVWGFNRIQQPQPTPKLALPENGRELPPDPAVPTGMVMIKP